MSSGHQPGLFCTLHQNPFLARKEASNSCTQNYLYNVGIFISILPETSFGTRALRACIFIFSTLNKVAMFLHCRQRNDSWMYIVVSSYTCYSKTGSTYDLKYLFQHLDSKNLLVDQWQPLKITLERLDFLIVELHI